METTLKFSYTKVQDTEIYLRHARKCDFLIIKYIHVYITTDVVSVHVLPFLLVCLYVCPCVAFSGSVCILCLSVTWSVLLDHVTWSSLIDHVTWSSLLDHVTWSSLVGYLNCSSLLGHMYWSSLFGHMT